jgi:hypothetical protein
VSIDKQAIEISEYDKLKRSRLKAGKSNENKEMRSLVKKMGLREVQAEQALYPTAIYESKGSNEMKVNFNISNTAGKLKSTFFDEILKEDDFKG